MRARDPAGGYDGGAERGGRVACGLHKGEGPPRGRWTPAGPWRRRVMATHWVFNDCDRQTKADAQSYGAGKEGRLSRHLTSFAPDGQDLRLTVSRQPQPSAFHVRAVLHLPTGKLVAEDTDKQSHVALDRVAHMLVEELKRHKEHLRRDHVYRRKTRRSSGRAGGPGTPREEVEGPAPRR